MGVLSLAGRLLFAFLFLSSGAQKLATFNLANGGPTLELMAPKMDQALASIEQYIGQRVDVPNAFYVYALGIAIFLELAGGVLYILGSKLGAWLLIFFLGTVTPIMHDFWNMKEGSEEQIQDMIQFFKNAALLGALLTFIGTRQRRSR